MSSLGNIQQRITEQSAAYSAQLLRDKLEVAEAHIDALVSLRTAEREELHELAKFISSSGLQLPENIQDIIARCMEEVLEDSVKRQP